MQRNLSRKFEVETDLDLPEAYRTQANLWKAKCLEYREELRKANKGLMRLSKQNKRFREFIRNLK